MLSAVDLMLWYRRLGLSEDARTIIDRIRCSEPARHVGGGKSNVCGRYPSRKMGRTIQFESHRLEFAVVLEMEDDPTVLEYYDQPCTIPLDYCTEAGRRIHATHTPDFFVLRGETAGWIECKTDEDLMRLAERSPARYCQDADGTWRCPPGQAYASSLGLHYRLHPSSDCNPILQRNISYLDDYLRGDPGGVNDDSHEAIMACVSACPGLSLAELIRRVAVPAATDCAYLMIARRNIYVDLGVVFLGNQAMVRVFPSKEVAAIGRAGAEGRPAQIDIVAGSVLQWDGSTWRVANVGESMVALVGAERSITELPVVALQKLIAEARVVVVPAKNSHVFSSGPHARLTSASERDLQIANRRLSILHAHKQDMEGHRVSERTLRFWAARYREAERLHGDGYVGLLPDTARRGNREARLPERTRALMQESIENDFETTKQKSKYACWVVLKQRCEQHEVVAPSYRAFRRAIAKCSRYESTVKRKGRRAAYKYEPAYWVLDANTPRHGDRPFEIGHIDHTELDIELRSTATGRNLGRPWMTILVDAFSRRILASYLSFDPPSYRSCMMVLRDCVRRHSRLPQAVVVDGGREFESTYFETLLARYECTKKTRPPAKARFGSVVERLFGTCNTQFIHNLRGNTQITREVRQVTTSVNPKGLAAWSLGDLNARLNEYLFEVYDRMDHPALGQTPEEAFARGFEASGQRLHRIIPYDQSFLLCTMPSTAKGTATVNTGRGVKIHHVYYWSDAFRDPELEQRQIPVRYDPFDAGIAYAFCGNRWVECHSEYYMALHGRSEREIMLATEELRKRHHMHSTQKFNLSARILATFLESVEDHEELLMQRTRDRESSAMRLGTYVREDHRHESSAASVSSENIPESIDTVEIYGEF
jgi:transposase InsO family protein